MLATFTDRKEKFTTSHRKEGKTWFEEYSILVPSHYNKNSAKAAVSLRLYGTDVKYYACIWVSGNQVHKHGSGSAGGYGYHKPSAAAQEAINNAGIDLDKSISGVGDSAIEEALHAIAALLGLDNYLLHHSHP